MAMPMIDLFFKFFSFLKINIFILLFLLKYSGKQQGPTV